MSARETAPAAALQLRLSEQLQSLSLVSETLTLRLLELEERLTGLENQLQTLSHSQSESNSIESTEILAATEERIAWSIVIANKGLEGFVDALLGSQEYMEAFGLETVPYQRSRVLAGHAKPQLPFNQKAPRYSAYWRDVSARRAPANPFAGGGAQFSGGQMSPAWVGGQPPKLAQTIWLALAAIGSLEVLRVLLTSAGAMLGTGSAG